MNLLFDQNVSFRIIQLISHVFPSAKQVRELNLENQTDYQIWEFAKNNQYCIVTFDSDFIDLSNLKGSPPKIIWLRIGNTSTLSIAKRILEEKDSILHFLQSDDSAFLELN